MEFDSFEKLGEHTAEIITSFSEFNNLRVLNLQFYYDDGMNLYLLNTYLQAVIDLAKKLQNLEQFTLSGVKLNEEIVVEFVEHAPKLKELHLHYCHFFSTRTLIVL